MGLGTLRLGSWGTEAEESGRGLGLDSVWLGAQDISRFTGRSLFGLQSIRVGVGCWAWVLGLIWGGVVWGGGFGLRLWMDWIESHSCVSSFGRWGRGLEGVGIRWWLWVVSVSIVVHCGCALWHNSLPVLSLFQYA